MSEKEIFIRVVDILKSVIKNDDLKIGPNTNLFEIGIDSITFMLFIIKLEEHFGICFPSKSINLESMSSFLKISVIIEECLLDASNDVATNP